MQIWLLSRWIHPGSKPDGRTSFRKPKLIIYIRVHSKRIKPADVDLAVLLHESERGALPGEQVHRPDTVVRRERVRAYLRPPSGHAPAPR